MKQIEEGLHKIHALAMGSEAQEPVSNVSDRHETETLEPFLRVNVVSPGSPAEVAVCYCVYVLFSCIHINLMYNFIYLTDKFIITI